MGGVFCSGIGEASAPSETTETTGAAGRSNSSSTEESLSWSKPPSLSIPSSKVPAMVSTVVPPPCAAEATLPAAGIRSSARVAKKLSPAIS